MIVYSPDAPFAIKAEREVPVYGVFSDVIVLDPGSNTPAIQKDANVSVQNAATILTNGQIQSTLGTNVSYVSQTPSIGEVNSNGYVTRVSNGTAKIKVTAGPDTQIVDVPVKLEDSADIVTLLSWRSGSLAKFTNDRVNNLISGVTPGSTSQALYVGANRNTSMFLSAYASSLTAVAYLIGGTPYMGFTAITTRHVVACAHIGDYSGLQVSFVTTGNVRVNRTLIKAYFVSGYDVAVYLLDSALPATIAPMRICPANLTTYLPNPQFQVPVVYPDRDQNMNIGCTGVLNPQFMTVSYFEDARGGFYRYPEIGTSGKPVILIYGSGAANMAIYGLFTYPIKGPSLHALPWTSIIPALDASAGVSTGLQPVRASFAAFTAYP